MGLQVCLEVQEALDPRDFLVLLVWMDLMALLVPKVCLELQVEMQEGSQVLLDFQDRKEREVPPTQEVQVSQEQREREGNQVVLDSQDSLDALDPLVRL